MAAAIVALLAFELTAFAQSDEKPWEAAVTACHSPPQEQDCASDFEMEHPHLLSAHRSKRHLIISPIDVAWKVHPTT